MSAFILRQYPRARQGQLNRTTPLLESGILDSLGILELVGYMEQHYKIVVSDEDLIPENFESIDRIASYIVRKLDGQKDS